MQASTRPLANRMKQGSYLTTHAQSPNNALEHSYARTGTFLRAGVPTKEGA